MFNKKQKVSIGILVLIIVGLIMGLFLVNQNQDIRDRASETMPTGTVLAPSPTPTPEACTTKATCKWFALKGVDSYCYLIEKMVNGAWVRVIPENASLPCIQTNDTKATFDSIPGTQYRCSVSIQTTDQRCKNLPPNRAEAQCAVK